MHFWPSSFLTALPAPSPSQTVVEAGASGVGAWDGWGSTILGAVVSAAVAFLVVRLQRGADRELAREDRRAETFAAFSESLLGVVAALHGEVDIRTVRTETLVRYHAWAMYLEPHQASFGAAVGKLTNELIEATDALLTRRRPARFKASEINRLATGLVMWGGRWHRDRSRVGEALDWMNSPTI